MNRSQKIKAIEELNKNQKLCFNSWTMGGAESVFDFLFEDKETSIENKSKIIKIFNKGNRLDPNESCTHSGETAVMLLISSSLGIR